jgi:hypothetical protein
MIPCQPNTLGQTIKLFSNHLQKKLYQGQRKVPGKEKQERNDEVLSL